MSDAEKTPPAEPEQPKPQDPAPQPEQEDGNGKKKWLLLLLLLLILVLLACGGYAYFTWWKKPTGDPVAVATPSAVATTAAPAAPSPTPAESPSPSPTAEPAPLTAVVPNLVGKRATEAERILHDLGLTELIFVDKASPDQPLSALESWVVVKQSIKPGTVVPLDTVITITCTARSNGNG